MGCCESNFSEDEKSNKEKNKKKKIRVRKNQVLPHTDKELENEKRDDREDAKDSRNRESRIGIESHVENEDEEKEVIEVDEEVSEISEENLERNVINQEQDEIDEKDEIESRDIRNIEVSEVDNINTDNMELVKPISHTLKEKNTVSHVLKEPGENVTCQELESTNTPLIIKTPITPPLDLSGIIAKKTKEEEEILFETIEIVKSKTTPTELLEVKNEENEAKNHFKIKSHSQSDLVEKTIFSSSTVLSNPSSSPTSTTGSFTDSPSSPSSSFNKKSVSCSKLELTRVRIKRIGDHLQIPKDRLIRSLSEEEKNVLIEKFRKERESWKDKDCIDPESWNQEFIDKKNSEDVT